MNYDMIGFFGIGFFVVMLLIYVGVIALSLWIGYLIMRTAVKNGVLLADEERARRAGPGVPPQFPQAPRPPV